MAMKASQVKELLGQMIHEAVQEEVADTVGSLVITMEQRYNEQLQGFVGLATAGFVTSELEELITDKMGLAWTLMVKAEYARIEQEEQEAYVAMVVADEEQEQFERVHAGDEDTGVMHGPPDPVFLGVKEEADV